MHALVLKLKRLKHVLHELNSTRYDDLPARIKKKRAELEVLQIAHLSEVPSRDSLEMELVVREELKELLSAEESFLRQKSRVLWIQEEDQNSRFFHSMIVVKQNMQAI
ncbi:hypothetical protein V6N13_096019 [Hibiscus sabdariffa]